MRSFHIMLIALVCGLGVLKANEHTFTSADGSKTITATIETYWPEKGNAQINVNGQRMVVAVSAFQAEDKKKFENWYQLAMAGKNIQIKFNQDKAKKSEKKLSNATITQYGSTYELEVRNNSQTDFDKVVLDYRVFYKEDLKQNNEMAKAGQLKVGNIAAKESKVFTSASVPLTSAKPKT